jgi:hypothetical protein
MLTVPTGHAVARLRSACCRTSSTCWRVTPGNHSRKSSILAPPSRFSNSARTGTRVPLNSHSPLTFPGIRSTAGQSRQSSMGSLRHFVHHKLDAATPKRKTLFRGRCDLASPGIFMFHKRLRRPPPRGEGTSTEHGARRNTHTSACSALSHASSATRRRQNGRSAQRCSMA